MIKIENIDQLIVKKSNELIEARYRLSLGEQRLILLLVSQIRQDDGDFKRYCIRVADFAKMFQLDADKSIYVKVQKAAEELVSKKVDLSIGERRIFVAWLSYVEYIEGSGIVELEFHSALKPYLLKLKESLKGFTQYQLKHVINFKSQYSIRFYEVLKKEARIKETYQNCKDFHVVFELTKLRFMLGVNDNEYPLFADFKRWVITPAKNEITKQTDLLVDDVIYLKTGRKVTSVRFNIIVRPLMPTIEGETIALKPKAATKSIADELIKLGFTSEAAHYCQKTYSVAHIERNIAYVKAKQQQGMVNDFPAYLNKAIKDDLGSAWEAEQAKQADEQAQRKVTAQQREWQLALIEERSQRENDRRMQEMLKASGKDSSFDKDELSQQLESLIKVRMQTL